AARDDRGHDGRADAMTAIGMPLSPRVRSAMRPSIVLSVVAVLAAALVGLGLICLIGGPVSEAIPAFLEGTFGSPYAVAASINRSVSFALVGIGFVIANRANLTN